MKDDFVIEGIMKNILNNIKKENYVMAGRFMLGVFTGSCGRAPEF